MRWPQVLLAFAVAVALAGPAGAIEKNDPARPLALRVLNPPGLPGMPLQILSTAEPGVIVKLQAAGMAEGDARDAAEQFIMPELRKRAPELERLIEDVFIEMFTPAELKAIPENEQTADRKSAAAKFSAVIARTTQVANTWMDGVRQEVVATNNDRFKLSPSRTGAPK